MEPEIVQLKDRDYILWNLGNSYILSEVVQSEGLARNSKRFKEFSSENEAREFINSNLS